MEHRRGEGKRTRFKEGGSEKRDVLLTILEKKICPQGKVRTLRRVREIENWNGDNGEKKSFSGYLLQLQKGK